MKNELPSEPCLTCLGSGRVLVASLLGANGVRDPEHPCDAFERGVPDGQCESDGHYLCGSCRHRIERAE